MTIATLLDLVFADHASPDCRMAGWRADPPAGGQHLPTGMSSSRESAVFPRSAVVKVDGNRAFLALEARVASLFHAARHRIFCIACRCLSALALVTAAAPPAIADAPLNVATYNLRLNLASDGANAWPMRKAAVMALIRYHEFDLLATQEGLPEQIDDLAGLPGFAYVGVGRDDGKRAGEHSAIFYRTARLSLEKHGDFWLSETPEKPSKGWDGRCCNRLATWAVMKDLGTGGRFFVLSAHFDHEGRVARRESAKLVLQRIQALAGSLPIVCMGDFNSAPDDEPITIMLAALRDSFKVSEAPPYGPVGTFNGFKPDAPLLDRIDYIFTNSRVRIQKYAALTDRYDARFPSDHLPVVARIVME
jgi:endonuclease/exonuclease/phosphatase family metal-dependent hydrolase